MFALLEDISSAAPHQLQEKRDISVTDAQKILNQHPTSELLEAELKRIANNPVTTPMLSFVIDCLKEMHVAGEPPVPGLYGTELLEFMQQAFANTKLPVKTLMTTLVYIKRATVPPGRRIEGRYTFANMLILAYKHDKNTIRKSMLDSLQSWAEALGLPSQMLQEGEAVALTALNHQLETETSEYAPIIEHFK